jgi:anti-anti-sigma factor
MLNLTVHDLGDVTIFRCAGRITFPYADELRNAIQKPQPGRVAVLDLAQVSAIDAAGLGMLVSMWKWSRANGSTLKLMNLGPSVENLLELTHLRSVFEICSVRDMLELLCRAFHQNEGVDAMATIEALDDIPDTSQPLRARTEAML